MNQKGRIDPIGEIERIAQDREEWQRKYHALLNQAVTLQAQRDELLTVCKTLISSRWGTIDFTPEAVAMRKQACDAIDKALTHDSQ